MTATKRISVDLSDLFFNHEHRHYDSAKWSVEYATLPVNLRDAILEDAKSFVESFGDGKLIPEMADATAEDLADDFMRRI